MTVEPIRLPSRDICSDSVASECCFRVLLAVRCDITRWVLEGLLYRLAEAECRVVGRSDLLAELDQSMAGVEPGARCQLMVADRELWLDVEPGLGVERTLPPLVLVDRDLPNRSGLPSASLRTPVDVDEAARVLAGIVAALQQQLSASGANAECGLSEGSLGSAR